MYYEGSYSEAGTYGNYDYKLSCLKQTFDITNYKYIKMSISSRTIGERTYSYRYGVVALSKKYNSFSGLFSDDSKPTLSTSNFPYSSMNTGNGTTILDISNATGNYYIYIGFIYYRSRYNNNYGCNIGQLYLMNN